MPQFETCFFLPQNPFIAEKQANVSGLELQRAGKKVALKIRHSLRTFRILRGHGGQGFGAGQLSKWRALI